MNSPVCFHREKEVAERDAVQNLASVVRTQQKPWAAGGSKVATCELLARAFFAYGKAGKS